jgi:hypothetical protein
MEIFGLDLDRCMTLETPDRVWRDLRQEIRDAGPMLLLPLQQLSLLLREWFVGSI